MHTVPFEETRKHVPADAPGAIHVYRPQTDFSQFIMDVVENFREMEDLQRVVILVQKGVPESVIHDATQRIAELLEGEKHNENKKIALECFHDLTRAGLRRLKRKWEQSRRNQRK